MACNRRGIMALAGLGGFAVATAHRTARADPKVELATSTDLWYLIESPVAGGASDFRLPSTHFNIMLGKLAAVGKVLVGGVEKSVPAWEQEIAAKPGLQLREHVTRMAQSSADGLLLMAPPRIYTRNPSGQAPAATPALILASAEDPSQHMPSATPAQGFHPVFALSAADYDIFYFTLTFCTWHFGTDAVGHPRTVHGGAIAMAIDESCGHAFMDLGRGPGYTAYLHVNYKAPLPAGIPTLITVTPTKMEGRKVYLAASLTDGMGKEFSSGECLYVMPRATSPRARAEPGEVSA